MHLQLTNPQLQVLMSSRGAKNPEQFDEPDDEALDMMGELLGENEED